VVGFAQSRVRVREDATTGGVEMLVPIFADVFRATGLTKGDIGFWCSGSSDYLAGRAFSFVQAVDAIGAVPPIMESHLEMDGAWALYEAWVKIASGEAETALAYGFGKSSGAELRRVLALQLDPYLVAPLWPDSVSVAALQARLGIEAGLWTEKDLAEVAARSRATATICCIAVTCPASTSCPAPVISYGRRRSPADSGRTQPRRSSRDSAPYNVPGSIRTPLKPATSVMIAYPCLGPPARLVKISTDGSANRPRSSNFPCMHAPHSSAPTTKLY